MALKYKQAGSASAYKKGLELPSIPTHEEVAGGQLIGGIDMNEHEPVPLMIGPDDYAKFSDVEMAVIEKFVQMTDQNLMAYVPKAKKGNNGQDMATMLGVEARLVLVHRLMMRGVNATDMATQLGCTPTTIFRLRKQVKERLKKQINQIDFGLYSAQMMSYYTEVWQMSMTMASSTSASDSSKTRSMLVAMKALSEQTAFLEKIGVFEALRKDNPMLKGLVSSVVEGQETGETEILDSLASSLLTHAMKATHQGEDIVDVG